MRRLGSSRRGLSTVITAGIMLSAVAVLGSAVVTWSNGNLKSFETVLSNTAASNTNKITESISIENIAFCSNCGSANSKNVTNVTLTNTGIVSVKITQIQLNSTTINSYYYSKNSPYSSTSCPPPSGTSACLPVTLTPKQSYTVSTSLIYPKTWGSQKPDTITITTARGSTFTTQAAPP
jgi:hypothetical protein